LVAFFSSAMVLLCCGPCFNPARFVCILAVLLPFLPSKILYDICLLTAAPPSLSPHTHTHTLVCNNIFLATKQVIDVSPLLFILSKNEYFSSHAKRKNVLARDHAIFFLPFSKGFLSSLLSHTFKV